MAYKRRVKWFLVIGGCFLIVLVIGGIFLERYLISPVNQKPLAIQRLEINEKSLTAEVVSKPFDLYRGLSQRASLCQTCGMLFLFPDSAPRTFVMRDMNFPLDIIFIEDDQIVNIAANLPPEGHEVKNYYQSGLPANRVLELNGGHCALWGIKVGDKIKFID